MGHEEHTLRASPVVQVVLPRAFAYDEVRVETGDEGPVEGFLRDAERQAARRASWESPRTKSGVPVRQQARIACQKLRLYHPLTRNASNRSRAMMSAISGVLHPQKVLTSGSFASFFRNW